MGRTRSTKTAEEIDAARAIGRAGSAKVRKGRWETFATRVFLRLCDQARTCETLGEHAAELMRAGVLTFTGKEDWDATRVRNVLDRFADTIPSGRGSLAARLHDQMTRGTISMHRSPSEMSDDELTAERRDLVDPEKRASATGTIKQKTARWMTILDEIEKRAGRGLSMPRRILAYVDDALTGRRISDHRSDLLELVSASAQLGVAGEEVAVVVEAIKAEIEAGISRARMNEEGTPCVEGFGGRPRVPDSLAEISRSRREAQSACRRSVREAQFRPMRYA